MCFRSFDHHPQIDEFLLRIQSKGEELLVEIGAEGGVGAVNTYDSTGAPLVNVSAAPNGTGLVTVVDPRDPTRRGMLVTRP